MYVIYLCSLFIPSSHHTIFLPSQTHKISSEACANHEIMGFFNFQFKERSFFHENFGSAIDGLILETSYEETSSPWQVIDVIYKLSL